MNTFHFILFTYQFSSTLTSYFNLYISIYILQFISFNLYTNSVNETLLLLSVVYLSNRRPQASTFHNNHPATLLTRCVACGKWRNGVTNIYWTDGVTNAYCADGVTNTHCTDSVANTYWNTWSIHVCHTSVTIAFEACAYLWHHANRRKWVKINNALKCVNTYMHTHIHAYTDAAQSSLSTLTWAPLK